MKYKRKKKLIHFLYILFFIALWAISFTSYSQIMLTTHQNGYANPSSPGFMVDKEINVCEDSTLYFKANYPFDAQGAYMDNQVSHAEWIKYNISGDISGSFIRTSTPIQQKVGDKNGDTLMLAPPSSSPASFYIKIRLSHLSNAAGDPDFYYWLKINYTKNPASPIVNITPTSLILGNSATLQVTPVIGVNFSWYSKDLKLLSVQNVFVTKPLNFDTLFYIQAEEFHLALKCVSDFTPVPILVQGNLYIPNAFTPNNDGKNDLFLVYGNEVKDMKLNIYNQWGALIFQSNDQTKGWDGKVNGTAQPRGMYIYTFTATIKRTGEKITRKGSVLLVR